ncbi:MAG: DNA-binding protein WhiA [Bacilli bacterium]|jgi:DNA-binding protein WhiA|nr:DNA-binding protein WhiA [Bacilli bacterium]
MARNGETFSKRIKEELALSTYQSEEKRAILSGFVRYSGALSIVPKTVLRLSSASASVAKFIFTSFKEVYKVQPKLTYTKQLRLNKSLIYHIDIEENPQFILKDLEILDGLERMTSSKRFFSEDLFHGFMIGTFLASGQISDPSSGRYFCEVVFNQRDEAELVLSRLLSFRDENKMNFKIIERRNRFVLYLKQSDQISVFLSYIGAVSMMFEFENARLERDYFNNENRLTICEQANYSRALKNGEGNLEDIDLLEKKIGKVYFTERTRILADIRKENKDASYQELAELAQKRGLTMTKSGVVHIFNKFHEDASKLR